MSGRHIAACLHIDLSEKQDAHGHDVGSHAAHGPEGGYLKSGQVTDKDQALDDEEAAQAPEHTHRHSFEDSITTQIIGVGILEFGVLLHR